MLKLADALREHQIYNDYGLLLRFGDENAVCLAYSSGGGMGLRGTSIYSPRFETNPDSHWLDRGAKVFYGNRAETMPQARAWAEKKYGITEWAPSPFGGALVPKYVRKAAEALVARLKVGEKG